MLKLVVWGEKLKADFVVNWYFNCLNGIQCTSILPVKHKRLHPNTVPWKSSHRTACHHRLPHIMLITHQCSENKNTQCDVQQNFILPNMLSSKIVRQKRKKNTHTKWNCNTEAYFWGKPMPPSPPKPREKCSP